MNYEVEVTNEVLTNAKTEEDFITIFNDKLATLILYFEEKSKLECCNNVKYAL